MVMGGVPFARVRGFESQHRILDGHPSLPLLTKDFNEFDYYGQIFYDIGLGLKLTRLDYPVFLNEPVLLNNEINKNVYFILFKRKFYIKNRIRT